MQLAVLRRCSFHNLRRLEGLFTMRKFIVFGLMFAATIALIAQPVPALSTPISSTLTLDTVYTGNIPDGSSPWLVATFTQTGSNTGTLTLTSDLSASDFLQGLSSTKSTIGWAFFLNQTLAGISCSSGDCASNNVLFGGSYNSGPVTGGFNLAFGWSSGSRFQIGSSAIYDLTFANSLTGDPFGLNSDNWSSVAHVQGIGPNGSCSGWIVSGTGTPQGGTSCTGVPPPNVPEPGTLGIFGLGILLAGLFVGLRRRWQ